MRYSKKTLLSIAVSLIVSLPASETAAQSHSIFRYLDELSQTTSPDDSWFKEVELVDVNLDFWPDIVLPQKQPCPGETCNPAPMSNIDHLYLSDTGVILAIDSPTVAFHFQPTGTVFPTSLQTTRNYDVELGDLDLDGRLDIVRPDRDGELKVLWGGSGPATVQFFTFTDVLDAAFGGNPNPECSPKGNYDDVDLADLDDDGDLDIVVAQWSSCGRNFLVENRTRIVSGGTVINGTPRTFQIRGVSPDELPAEFTHSVSFGDANQDGAQDVVLANRFGVTRKPQLFLGTGQPFDFQSNPIEFLSPGISGEETTVADLVDLNGDGRLDLYIAQGVFSSPPSAPHGVYFHSGNNADPYPAFTPWPESAPFSTGLYDARYGDLDNDGSTEIVVVNFTITEDQQRIDTEIHIAAVPHLGSQLVNVSSAFLPGGLEGGIAVDLEDLDLDGDLDMVLGGISTDPNMVYSAAHLYENRTYTHLYGRPGKTLLPGGSYWALRSLDADSNLTIPAGTVVTLEVGNAATQGETINLGDGFTAQAGSEVTIRAF